MQTPPESNIQRPQNTAAQATGPAINSLVPAGTATSEFLRRTFAAATLTYAVYYLYWRWTETLNPQALWFAIPLALAETFALTAAAFFVFNVWRLRRRTPRRAPQGLSVDVFITTYNEPVDLIRKTALGAREIRYPHRTYILDDGSRAEVRDLAAEIGVEYIRRANNAGAKAGNLNHALRYTRGDFILQLDADHVPRPEILDRMLGYFADPLMAFVQSPQCFYNHDGFTGHADPNAGRYYAEQDIFFNVIQPGKDRHNAAFFCGSCAVIRRTALTQIGGFSAYSITEDFETSLRLHARGWRSAYHAEPLAYGLATRTAESFHTQRVRWGRGTMQVWRRFNPLTLRGLTFAQRICYFYSVLVYLDGLPRLVFYLAPVIYLTAGILPIQSTGLEFLGHFLPLFSASVLLNRVMARGYGAPFWLLERNNLAKVWTHTLALTGYLTRRPLRFGVTGKSVGGVALRHLAPHIILVGVTVGALLWGSFAFATNSIIYGSAGSAALPFLVNVAWACWNGFIACLVLRTALASRERRTEYRFPDKLPVAIAGIIPAFRTQFELGTLMDINATGAAIRVGNAVELGSQVQLVAALPDTPVSLRAVVVRVRADWRAGRHSHVLGLSFAAGQHAQRDRISRHCLQYVTPLVQDRNQRPEPFFVLPRMLRRAQNSHKSRPDVASDLLHAGDRQFDSLLLNVRELCQWGSDRRFTDIARRALASSSVILLLLGLQSRPAHAQLPSGYVAAVERADNGQRVYLLGGWWTRARTGWSPTANVFGYRIELGRGAQPDALWAVNPAVGLRHQWQTGGLQGTVGYTWQNASGNLAAGTQRVGSGVTTAAQADYWGSGANMAQLIGSYSWGGDGYVWSRARGSRRISQSGAAALRLGAELGWQGNEHFKATDVGGVIEWQRRPFGLVAAVGYRSVQEGAVESASYISLAAVLIP